MIANVPHDDIPNDGSVSAEKPEQTRPLHGAGLTIPQGLEFDGELLSSKPLRVEGVVRGRIRVTGHDLSIEPKGQVAADVVAKNVVVRGSLEGNVEAQDKVEITSRGKVRGQIRARRLVLADGSQFNGSVNVDYATQRVEPASPEVDRKPTPRPASSAVFVPRLVADEPTAPQPLRKALRSLPLWTLLEAKRDS